MRKNCFSKKKIQHPHPPPPPEFFFYTIFFFLMLEIAWNVKKTWFWFWPLKVIQGQLKDHIYDFVYVFYTNIGHSMHSLWNIGLNRSQRSKLDLSDFENINL